MAERVVDLLEIVGIDEQQSIGLVAIDSEQPLEDATVVQPCQVIMLGLAAQRIVVLQVVVVHLVVRLDQVTQFIGSGVRKRAVLLDVRDVGANGPEDEVDDRNNEQQDHDEQHYCEHLLAQDQLTKSLGSLVPDIVDAINQNLFALLNV